MHRVHLCPPFWIPNQEYTKPNSCLSLIAVVLHDSDLQRIREGRDIKSVVAMVNDDY